MSFYEHKVVCIIRCVCSCHPFVWKRKWDCLALANFEEVDLGVSLKRGDTWWQIEEEKSTKIIHWLKLQPPQPPAPPHPPSNFSRGGGSSASPPLEAATCSGKTNRPSWENVKKNNDAKLAQNAARFVTCTHKNYCKNLQKDSEISQSKHTPAETHTEAQEGWPVSGIHALTLKKCFSTSLSFLKASLSRGGLISVQMNRSNCSPLYLWLMCAFKK